METKTTHPQPATSPKVIDRAYYLDLAKQGTRLPISAHMTLHQRPDPKAARYDGQALGEVIIETAQNLQMPLAFPLMDLQTEKEWLLGQLEVAPEAIDTYHFEEALDAAQEAALSSIVSAPATPRMQATLGAIAHVRAHSDLVAVGMCIGPFSLATKLLEDPITAAYQVSLDPTDEDAELLLKILDIGSKAICRWVEMQIEAGAQAICVCEPAYNTVYISPNEIERNPDILNKLALDPNRAIKEKMQCNGVEMILHDCGELNEAIIRSFAELDPAILSLGSPCDLPNVAHLVDKNTVIMGNLPSKKFYSDKEITAEEVMHQGRELLKAMEATGHPFILGTECDVLCVEGCEATILKKVEAVSKA